MNHELEKRLFENPIRKVDITVPMRAYNTIRTGDNGRMFEPALSWRWLLRGSEPSLQSGKRKTAEGKSKWLMCGRPDSLDGQPVIYGMMSVTKPETFDERLRGSASHEREAGKP